MASSTSTKKAARLAQKGKGRKVRFQGGTVFPAAVAAVMVLGVAGITYARATVPADDASEPTIDQHWHAAHGFNLCGEWYQVVGALEEVDSRGQLANVNFLRTGIHSHDDGAIHWHPSTSRSVGKNAVLGVFLETYGIALTNEAIRFPSATAVGPNENFPGAGAQPLLQEYVEGETKCDGEDAEVAVKAWDNFGDAGPGKRYIAEMDRIHVDDDGMVFSIYFLPKDADQSMPPWASNLPALGAVDSATEASLDDAALQVDQPDGAAAETTGTDDSGSATSTGG